MEQILEYEDKIKQYNRIIRKCKREPINDEIQQIDEGSKHKITRKFYQRISEESRTYKQY